MTNILILENRQHTAIEMFETIDLNFRDCKCYPRGPYENNFREMRDFINKIRDWGEEADSSKKLLLKEELKKFVSEKILNRQQPHFAIIDVSLLLEPIEGKDELGAKFRKEILATTYPELQVLYSTINPEKVLETDYNVNGRDTIHNKEETSHETFRESFFEKFKEYSGLVPDNKDQVNIRFDASKNEFAKRKIPVSLQLESFADKFSIGILETCRMMKMVSILISVTVFLVGFAILLKNLLFELPSTKEHSVMVTLDIIEKLFIVPLPMIIVTSFFLFFDQVILMRFNPRNKGFGGIEVKSKYYISLSKSLFISTLISVLAIQLVRISFENTDKEINTNQYILLGTAILVLFGFYFMIARSIHSILKTKQIVE